MKYCHGNTIILRIVLKLKNPPPPLPNITFNYKMINFPNMYMLDMLLYGVEKITFLGIVIDEFLTWRDHIDLIAKKIIKCAAIISRIRHFTNLNSLKLIYYALVYPYLTYGNLIWGNAYKSHIQKLVNIQKKIIRLMTFKSYFDHTEPIFNDLKILNLYKLNEYLTSCLCSDIFICKIFPRFLIIIFGVTKISIIIIQETHHCYTKNVIEQIMKNTHLLIKESMCGIIFLRNIKKLDLFSIFKSTMKKYFLHPDKNNNRTLHSK